jgi:hypothetical protein
VGSLLNDAGGTCARAFGKRSEFQARCEHSGEPGWRADCTAGRTPLLTAVQAKGNTMSNRKQASATPSIGRAWHLDENAAMRLPRGKPALVVRVERGTVLVTQAGDLEDHLLEEGEAFVLAGRGLAVAWAFTEATISVNVLERSSAGGRAAPSRMRRSASPLQARASAQQVG